MRNPHTFKHTLDIKTGLNNRVMENVDGNPQLSQSDFLHLRHYLLLYLS